MQKLKIWLYFIITLLWISGLAFFILKTWFQIPGEFGITTNPYQYTALQVHGFFALIMMVTFGYVLGTHVPKVFKLKPTSITKLISNKKIPIIIYLSFVNTILKNNEKK